MSRNRASPGGSGGSKNPVNKPKIEYVSVAQQDSAVREMPPPFGRRRFVAAIGICLRQKGGSSRLLRKWMAVRRFSARFYRSEPVPWLNGAKYPAKPLPEKAEG